jgi:hypothetical protein
MYFCIEWYLKVFHIHLNTRMCWHNIYYLVILYMPITARINKQHICKIARTFEVQAILDFCTTCPPIHYKFSPLIHHTWNLEFHTSWWTDISSYHTAKLGSYLFFVNEVPERPIPVATWSWVWVCSCSLAGILGSNPARSMDACRLSVLCVVRQRSLRRADHLSRGDLPSFICMW